MDGEKSKGAVGAVAGAATGRSKKRPGKSKSVPKAAWGKLLSQCSQVWFHC